MFYFLTPNGGEGTGPHNASARSRSPASFSSLLFLQVTRTIVSFLQLKKGLTETLMERDNGNESNNDKIMEIPMACYRI